MCVCKTHYFLIYTFNQQAPRLFSQLVIDIMDTGMQMFFPSSDLISLGYIPRSGLPDHTIEQSSEETPDSRLVSIMPAPVYIRKTVCARAPS